MNWSGTLQGAFGGLADAGAALIRAKADREAAKNNSPVSPSNQRLQPWMIWGGAGLLVLVVVLALRRR